ncbi:MAG TPA: hypothetical protein VKY31_02355 [Terriglobia bacterium]|nr:hypothetical protein [Terriglobia bacterium]
MNKANCEKKTELLAIYHGVAEIYSKAVAELMSVFPYSKTSAKKTTSN